MHLADSPHPLSNTLYFFFFGGGEGSVVVVVVVDNHCNAPDGALTPWEFLTMGYFNYVLLLYLTESKILM